LQQQELELVYQAELEQAMDSGEPDAQGYQ
jgi:hypothetical protein